MRLKKYHDHLADLATTGKSARGLTIRLSINGEEEDVILPPKLAQAFPATIAEVAGGHAVHVSRVDEEVTTCEAADSLKRLAAASGAT